MNSYSSEIFVVSEEHFSIILLSEEHFSIILPLFLRVSCFGAHAMCSLTVLTKFYIRFVPSFSLAFYSIFCHVLD